MLGRRLHIRAADREHRRVQAQLSDFLDGALAPGQGAQVEAHARICERCRGAVLSPPSTTRLLRSLHTYPPPDLIAGILARLATQDPNQAGEQQGDIEAPVAADDREKLPQTRHRATVVRARAAVVDCLRPRYLRRTLPTTLIVGLVLTAIYQLGDLVAGRAGAGTYLMCACNFAIAFVLASLATLVATSAARGRQPPDRGPN